MSAISLRPLCDNDLPMLERWLYAPHVARWYAHPADWLAEMRGRNGEYAFIHHFIAEWDEKPFGFCQYYLYALGGETWHGGLDITGAYSLDYLIGDVSRLGKGLGKAMVLELLKRIQAVPEAKSVIVQPEAANRRSRQTLLSCGFEHLLPLDVYWKGLTQKDMYQ